jgi:hypothetical protein
MAFTQDWSPMEVPTTPDEKRRQLDEDYRNDDELDRERLSRAESPDPDDDLDEDDDLDDDDLDLDDTDDDVLPDYDEDLDDDDLDDEDLDDDDDTIVGSATDEEPDELPEQGESDNESLNYPHEQELNQQQGDDASYSEQVEVTPPQEHNTPLTGGSVSFESRPQGRTTGRMIDHEPGTTGI